MKAWPQVGQKLLPFSATLDIPQHGDQLCVRARQTKKSPKGFHTTRISGSLANKRLLAVTRLYCPQNKIRTKNRKWKKSAWKTNVHHERKFSQPGGALLQHMNVNRQSIREHHAFSFRTSWKLQGINQPETRMIIGTADAQLSRQSYQDAGPSLGRDSRTMEAFSPDREVQSTG